VTTITTATADGPREVRDAWGVTHHLAGSQPGTYSRAWASSLVTALLALHEREGVDVIASQSAAAFPYLARRPHLPARQRIPTALMNHGSVISALPEHLRAVWGHPLRMLGKRLPQDLAHVWNDRRMYPRAEAITALSEMDKAAMRRWLAVPPSRITVIANGVDTNQFRPSDAERQLSRAQLGIADDVIAIMVIARLESPKGQQVLLQALVSPTLHPWSARWRLILVGDGQARDSLRRLAERLGLAPRIQFLGQTPHTAIPALLNAADIVAAPSLTEAMPLSVLEAMACGRAVVASQVGAIGDVVTHCVNGLLVPPAAPLALARAIATFASDREHAARLGAQAREDVAARYTLARTMSSYEEVLLRAASRRANWAAVIWPIAPAPGSVVL
jgi:glycosyltransferase involved in cell wall biosynthesis